MHRITKYVKIKFQNNCYSIYTYSVQEEMQTICKLKIVSISSNMKQNLVKLYECCPNIGCLYCFTYEIYWVKSVDSKKIQENKNKMKRFLLLKNH